MATAGMHHLRRRDVVHYADIEPRSNAFVGWERVRHRQAHWFVECAAEFMGVFFYVYAGVGSTANFLLGGAAGIAGLSSMFQIGAAYAFGILFALIVCAPTSGGHFNPVITVCLTLLGKFPAKKAPRYIAAQILGSYVACLLIYVQWYDYIKEVTEVLEASGKLEAVMFTPNGPAGVFALYAPTGVSLGRIFLNEFVCDFLIGLVIFASVDPTNFGATPATGPWIIAFAYATMVWGYATVGIATNAARDVGARLMALTIWGLPAGGGSYAAIAALTNFPATICAMLFYTYVLSDSSRTVTPAWVDYFAAHLAHAEHSQESHGRVGPHNVAAADNDSVRSKASHQQVESV
ncbi:aquaporin-like protein [Epithele typhae]|uniref:aquaporin-like protein n=1 Tax=Epithele typhae TaxID=378194 RepID=UPI0020085EEF|nr:aquaporin-like protein [Epithele typhae]KAH9940547.1 aquaporin-like protein [Epithele typhae]